MNKLLTLMLLGAIVCCCAHDRGCIYIDGECEEECEEGSHSYTGSCDAPTWSQRTCDKPTPTDLGGICDLSRCDCDLPKVLDEKSGKCVDLKDCPVLPPSNKILYRS